MILEMKGVSVRRDGNWLLKGVDWQIREGEHWVLFGLNGAGKTTLLNVLNAYIFPYEGEVTVLGLTFGKDYLRENLRKHVAFVSDSLKPQIELTETAAEVMLSGLYGSTNLYNKPTNADIDKVVEMLHFLGCYEYRNRGFETLSQGEKQRVLIGRALMSDPRLLVLDEPTGGLDFIAREQLLEVVEKVAKREDGPSIIYVTHHAEEIIPEFTHTLLLKKGEVYRAGLTAELLVEDVLSDYFEVPVDVVWKNERLFLSKKRVIVK